VARDKTTLPAGVPEAGGAPAAPEGKTPPPHGTPKKLTEADVAGKLPRVVDQLARVPSGSKAKRFKCRAINYDSFRAPKYVLALDRESARECHVEAIGLAGYLQSLRDAGAKEADVAPPQVHVVELPD
jgi:hypothetical protein